MLLLKKKIDLESDIYEQIPSERINIPEINRNSAEHVNKLNFRQTRLSIVGQEKNGILLVSYDGFGSKGNKITYIDIFDTKSKTLRKTYKHGTVMNCVNASISENGALLAFTVIETTNEQERQKSPVHNNSNNNNKQSNPPSPKTSQNTKSEKQIVFQSYITELRKGGNVYKLSIKNPDVQRVQFLYTEKSKIVYVLFFLEGIFVHLYQVPIRITKKGVEITTQPNLVSIIVKQHVWCEWDPHKNNLYILQKNIIDQDMIRSHSVGSSSLHHHANADGNHNSVSNFSTTNSGHHHHHQKKHYILKLYHIPDRIFKQIWEIPLRMNLPMLSSRKSVSSYFSGIDHRATNPISRYLTIVQLDGNSFCLCQQNPADLDQALITVSIYLLHTKERVDISIPMNTIDQQIIQETKVLFGVIANMIIIYIPNVYLQFLDCGAEHQPCLGLTLRGYPESATSLPRSNFPNESDMLIRYPTNVDSSSHKGHCFLDTKNGTVYEYLINREYVSTLLTQPISIDLQAQIMHLVICHLKDVELLENIMVSMCSNYPENISTSFLKEYLIGSVYMSIKLSQHNNNPVLLTILPVSSIHPFKYQITRDKYSELGGYYVLPSSTLIIKDREQLKLPPRFQHDFNSPISPSDRFIEINNQNQNKLQNFFRGLLTSSNSREELNTNPLLEEDLDSSLFKPSTQLVELLVNHITACFPKILKPNAVSLVKYYRNKIVTYSNKLYQYIYQNFDKEKARIVLFQVLECLYCTLEELSYPCPKGFSNTFVTLGEKCLRRNVFLQYVERGVFRLNDEFIISTISKLKNTNDDKLFKYELLSNYQNRKQCFQILREHTEYIEYLMQYYLANLPLSAPSKEDLSNPAHLESTNYSIFIPRSVFLNAILSCYHKQEYQTIVAFIKENRQQLHSSILRIFEPKDSNNNNSNDDNEISD